MQRESLNAADISIRYHKTADSFRTDNRVVDAAYEVAKAAHAHQIRGKANKSIPYIIHPVMVHDLLHSHGERDKITLAAALLHDAREDCPAYEADPTLMRKDLANALSERSIKDAGPIAAEIDGICAELTNGSMMEEGKRTWQVEHAGRISRRGAELKILDQMASVLDGIMEPDDEEFPAEKKRKWNYKALNVVKSAASDREGLQYWKDLFKVLFTYQMHMIEHPELEDAMRADFDFSKAVQAAIEYPHGKPDVAATHTCNHPRIGTVDTGCVAVQLSEEGEVVGYSILANPSGDKHDPRNAQSIRLVASIEATDDKRRVTVNPTDVLEGRLVRNVKVKPPLDAKEFSALAKDVGALDHSFATQLQDFVRNQGEEKQR